MRKRTGFLSMLGVGAIAVVSLAACGGYGNNGNTGKISVTVAPTAASVPVNGQAQFTATVSNTSNTTVTWQVNGTAGGSAATGTIVTDNANPLQGDFTAPATVPSANNGQVTITAVSQADTSVVSNSATVTITAAQGLQVVPSSTSVPAGTSKTFSAMLNGSADANVTWQATTPGGGNPGSINPSTGVYTAPNAPPPGNSVTITATDATAGKTGTAAVTINFANASLKGNFAFAYNGDDGSGFLSVAGSFATDGKGNITNGVEDENSLGNVSPITTSFTGTYTFTTGGRGTLTFNTANGSEILHFVLSAPDANGKAHGLIIRFDTSSTASGTIDQQNTAEFSAPNIVNNYVFSVSGIDGNTAAVGAAGAFGADGSGSLLATNGVIDINDASATSVTTNDTTLRGTYTFDTSAPGNALGRGTLIVTSTGITNTFGANAVEFAFYMVDSTHLKLLEIDTNAILAGDVFSSSAGNGSPLNTTALLTGGFAFTLGGTSKNGPFASGGVFVSGGSGSVTGGVIDINDGGVRIPLDKPLTSSGYSVDANTGRITLALTAGGTSNYAAYATNLGSVLLLEVDTNPVASGVAFAQTSKIAPSGNYAVNLTGSGLVKNTGSFEQDVLGQIAFSGTTLTGILDINNLGSNTTLFPNTTLTNSTTTAPDTNGRGTIAATANTNPTSQYQLVYYVIDANTVLLFDSDGNRVATGTVVRQF
ncbi:MAG: beta strand repeat-containing protein [Candidatus Acidiferrales bacterium]